MKDLKKGVLYFIMTAMITTVLVKINGKYMILLYSEKGLVAVNKSKSNLTKGMFFGVITMPGDKRQNFSYSLWMKDLKKYQPNSESAFVCAEGKEIEGVKYLHPTKEQMDIINLPKPKKRDRDISMKRLIAAKYFIENTSLEWFWSTSDDCAVDLSKLDGLLDELDFLYDTENDLVFQGHCIVIDNIVYLQGGSGYIFSRKAAEQFVKIGDLFISNIVKYDDMAFHSLFEFYQIEDYQIATSHLIGHKFEVPDIKDEKMSNIEDCPAVVPYSYCYKRNLYPVQDLVGYHRSDIEVGISVFKSMVNITKKYKNLYFYQKRSSLHFCKKKNGDELF